MKEWVRLVIGKWKAEGVKINAGASTSLIVRAQTSLGFNFPEDFIDFYLAINGFEDYDWQEHMFSFWSLERIMKEAGAARDRNFIPFCDFLISSHYIGFKKNQSGIFKLYYRAADNETITDSFQKAVEMINSSDDLIY